MDAENKEEAMISFLPGVSCYGIRTIIAFAALLLASGAMAAPAVTIERAPVVIDGEALFQLRGISSHPAKQRADGVAERIRAIARDASVPVSDLGVVEAQERSEIRAGERHILSVFDVDAEAEQAGHRQKLAEFYKTSVARAIERHRHERGGDYLRAQGIHAAIVIGLLVALLFAMRWLIRWM
jgi:hypothetical protein